MQKKVLAAVIGALLASPAVFADSANVTISGRFAFGVENYKLSGGTRTEYSGETRVSDQSSSLVFSGTEDLGGGLGAWFQIDTRFNEVGTISAGGNTLIGLSGTGWGKLGLGRSDVHYNEFAALGIPLSGSLQNLLGHGLMSQVLDGSPNGTSTAVGGASPIIANGTRTPNIILWDSPKWGGLTARVGYSSAWNSTGAAGSAQEGSGVSSSSGSSGRALTAAVRYTDGPLAVGTSWWDATSEGGSNVGDQESVRAWAGYTLPFGLRVGVGYDKSGVRETANAGMSERTAILVPVTYKFGANTVYLHYAMADDLDRPTGTVSSSGADVMSVGFERALSKRTHAGIHYAAMDNDSAGSYDLFGISATGATSTAAGEDAKQIYLGVTHFF